MTMKTRTLYLFLDKQPPRLESHTLSLHDALPICMDHRDKERDIIDDDLYEELDDETLYELVQEEKRKILEKEMKERSEEHTSELQSRGHLVCRHLLENRK